MHFFKVKAKFHPLLLLLSLLFTACQNMSSIESETRNDEQQICDTVTHASIQTLVLDDSLALTLNTSEMSALANANTLNYPYISNHNVILSGHISDNFSVQNAYQEYYQVQLSSTVHNTVKAITAPQVQQLQIVESSPSKFSSNSFMVQLTTDGALINLVSLQLQYNGIYTSCVASTAYTAFR